MPVEIVEANPVMVIERELEEEFADLISGITIETLAEEEVARFEDARVRDFVTLFAGRRARVRAKEIVAEHRTATAVGTALD